MLADRIKREGLTCSRCHRDIGPKMPLVVDRGIVLHAGSKLAPCWGVCLRAS
jgi:hypothetical protein